MGLGSGTVRVEPQPAMHWRLVSTPSASIGLSSVPSKSAKPSDVKAARLGGASGRDVLENAVPVKSSSLISMDKKLSVLEVPVTRYSSRGPGKSLLTVIFSVSAI